MDVPEVLDDGQQPSGPNLLASKGTRFGNFVLDSIALSLISFPIGLLPFMQGAKAIFENQLEEAKAANDMAAMVDATLHYVWISMLVGGIINLFYFVALEHMTGRTLGKIVTKTKVVNADGTHPDFGTIVIRSLCRFIPFEILSYLFGPVGWHDRISGTRVVNDEPVVGVGY